MAGVSLHCNAIEGKGIQFLSVIRGQSGGFGTGRSVPAPAMIPQASVQLKQQISRSLTVNSVLHNSSEPEKIQCFSSPSTSISPRFRFPPSYSCPSWVLVNNSSSWLWLPLTRFCFPLPLSLYSRCSQWNSWQWKVTPSSEPPHQVQVQLPMTSCLVASGNQTAGTWLWRAASFN